MQVRLAVGCRVSTRGGAMVAAHLLVGIAFEERVFIKLMAPAFAYYGLRCTCRALVETGHALTHLLGGQVHSNAARRSASASARWCSSEGEAGARYIG